MNNISMIKKCSSMRQRGVAMIEVLVVFFVLSIGLLGMAALQMRAMQYNESAYMRSQATVAANDMLDRIRLSRGVVTAGDLLAWKTTLADVLPIPAASQPSAVCNAGICTVTIIWINRMDRDGGGPDTDGATPTEQVSITTQI